MRPESFDRFDAPAWRALPLLAGLVVGAAVAFVYDGPYELAPVALALVVVALAEYART